mmetsp:Transcript_4454/g.11714  ORF Transcript_4454/g.11714 Transcript_4454/m.11714 type:complete len:267 (-) Transcript_4454:14-814(-)
MTNVTPRAVTKRIHSVRSMGWSTLSAPTTTEGRTIPPNARPTPKQVPHHRPLATLTATGSELRDRPAKSGKHARAPHFHMPTPSSRREPRTPPSCPAISSSEGSRAVGGHLIESRRLSCGIPPLMTADAIAATMKMGTATRDRSERRERPQRPCPEVQPFPREVPTPMTIPPRNGVMVVALGFSKVPSCITRTLSNPAITRPQAKAIAAGSDLRKKTTDFSAPLLPAMLAVRSMKKPLAKPMKAPPSAACKGTNGVIGIARMRVIS